MRALEQSGNPPSNYVSFLFQDLEDHIVRSQPAGLAEDR